MEIFLPVTLWSLSVALICCASKSDLISFQHKNLILEQDENNPQLIFSETLKFYL